MNYRSIGKQIRAKRIELRLTQERLAERCDLSVSYMGAVERGDKIPSLETFITIANALGASSDDLLSGVLAQGNNIVAFKLSVQLEGLSYLEQRRILSVVQTMIKDFKTLQ